MTASSLPRYLEVKARLKQMIESGKLAGKIPAEKDMAEEFGVSYMTARRAVTELVNEGVMARELGRGTFVNPDARRCATQAIVFAMSSLNPHGMRNPYFFDVFCALEAASREHGYATIFSNRLADVLPTDSAATGLGLNVAGIVATAVDDRQALIDWSQRLPVVLINNWTGAPLPLPCIRLAQKQGAMEAVAHLLALGHQRIAHIAGDGGVWSSDEREAGYREAMRNAGFAKFATCIPGDWTYDGGYRAMAELLTHDPVPSAVFAANDLMAIGATRCAADHGLDTPKQLSVCGFGDSAQAAHTIPGLATVAVCKETIGRTAFALINAMIKGESPQSPPPLATQLVIRDSTAPLAATGTS